MYKSTKYHILYLVIFIIITGFAIWGTYIGTESFYENISHAIEIPTSDMSPDFSARRISEDEVGKHKYTYQLPKDAFDALTEDTYRLIISKITDNAIQASINGHIILSEGDLETAHSMFKNSQVYGTFDRKLLKENNEIEIETYAIYKTGIEFNAIYITNQSDGVKACQTYDFFYNRLIIMGLGFLFFSTIFTIYVYINSTNKDISLIFCSIATLSLSIYFVDYLKIPYLAISYFSIKKIFLLFLSFGLFFYGIAIYRYLKKKVLMATILSHFIWYVIIFLFSSDLIQFKTWYEYWYFGLLICILIYIIYFIFNVRKSSKLYIFLLSFIFLGIYTSYAILIEFKGGYFTINSPFLYMSILATLPMLLGFDAIHDKERLLAKEKKLREEAFIASMSDDLTGAWNKRFLKIKMEEINEDATAAMLDIDSFKEINDTYGHRFGDHVIKEIASTIMNNIRKNDYLCRYGGDEFIIILQDTTVNDANKVMKHIQHLIDNQYFEVEKKSINVSFSIGITKPLKDENPNDFLHRLDLKMYEAKNKGKNRIISD